MKTRFPLFAKLLLWFFVNLLVLTAGLMLMMRIQFGSFANLLLPISSQNEIQAMSAELMHNLAHSNQCGLGWRVGGNELRLSNAISRSTIRGGSGWRAQSLSVPERIHHSP